MKRRWRDEAGMTLLEVMLACGVMAMSLSMLFGAMVSMKTLGDVERDTTRATLMVANALEQMRNTSASTLMSTNMTLTDGPGVRRTIQLKVSNSGGSWITLPSATSIGSLPNPLEVQATLVWEDERGRVFSRAASTKVPR